jgi:hypothetical protein
VFEGSYVYGGSRPTVMTDASGKRASRPFPGGKSRGRGSVLRDEFFPRSGGVANPLGQQQNWGVPGWVKNLCVKWQKNCQTFAQKLQGQDPRAKEIQGQLGLDFLETAAEAGGFEKSVKFLASVDSFEDCVNQKDRNDCARSAINTIVELSGGGAAAFNILSGPAQCALFKLVDYTTDFVTMVATTVTESTEALSNQLQLRIVSRNGFEGKGSVRYWDGAGYQHTMGDKFWVPTGAKKLD